jgi:hypothetical protein
MIIYINIYYTFFHLIHEEILKSNFQDIKINLSQYIVLWYSLFNITIILYLFFHLTAKENCVWKLLKINHYFQREKKNILYITMFIFI